MTEFMGSRLVNSGSCLVCEKPLTQHRIHATMCSKKCRNKRYKALPKSREEKRARENRRHADAPHLKHARDRKWDRTESGKASAYSRLARRRIAKHGSLGSHTTAEWLAIKKKQKLKCAECGRKRLLTRDHIVPVARGGSDFAFNIQGLCRPCNSGKRDRLRPYANSSLFDRAILGAGAPLLDWRETL